MDTDASTMATMTMESWDELVHCPIPEDDVEYLNITSEELYRCIDEDTFAYSHFPSPIIYPDESDEIWTPEKDEVEQRRFLRNLEWKNEWGLLRDCVKDVPSSNDTFVLPEYLKTCIDPRTLQPSLFLHTVPEEDIKPYHPSQDHDYLKIDSEDSDAIEVKEEIDEGEPVVDVWKIENFSEEQVLAPRHVPEQLPTYKQILRDRTRRTSKRTADIKRREQARKISHAVHAVLNIKKPATGRQYKNKPKNSVETTPYQSDIEEWHSQVVRPMHTKITKKKTSKGRIDHSLSERNRREILRKKFSQLRKSIPLEFLRGEKASSQISKQKILNGAKGYIAEIYKFKSSYSSTTQQNKMLKELWQKKHTTKLQKSVKKHK